MPIGTPPLGSGNVQKVKNRLEKSKKESKINLPGKYHITLQNKICIKTFHKMVSGVLMGGPGMAEQLSSLTNEELRKCVNAKGYVVPETCYEY